MPGTLQHRLVSGEHRSPRLEPSAGLLHHPTGRQRRALMRAAVAEGMQSASAMHHCQRALTGNHPAHTALREGSGRPYVYARRHDRSEPINVRAV